MSDVNNLFWTGGWDSTFRLLQIVLDEKRKVQPYYVIRPQECTGKEIDTIINIRRELGRDFPESKTLLLPVQYIDESGIQKDKAISNEHENISEQRHIASQYEKLARFCKQIGVKNMELSVLSSETFGYFRSNTTIFQYFECPLLGLTKSEMAEIADSNGWTKYMDMTWFCRRPKKNRPCGFCGPCTDVVIAGMGRRLPLRARVLANIQLPFRKWWRNNYHKQSEGFSKHVKKFLKKKA